jgi:2-C-methyl-D-erythritol 2,4-cyclodiphosphate synthase
MTPRVGLGFDSHIFGADRPLRLAGVVIPHETGLAAHSDGDAVAHAVTDALLGAAALGDIGQMFPDTDPAWRGADSMRLLADARERVVRAGFALVNVDVTVILERPKLAPHVPAMRQRLAAALGLPVSAVSVKAKTNEGMDAVGRGEGIQVFAVAAVEAR